MSDFIKLAPERLWQASADADAEGDDYRVVPTRVTPLENPQHPEIITFSNYLAGLAAGRAMPDRADINPAEILPFLPHLMILDVIGEGDDFRVRVYGTGLVNLTCEERTGLLASEFGVKSTIYVDLAEVRARWLKVFGRAFREARPIHFKAPTVSPDRSYMHYHGMFAPLTKGSDKVSQIIGMMIAVRA